MQNPVCANRMKSHSWLWALLPLLLAAALAIPLLDIDAFNGDEPASLFSAGILASGPRSLADVWEYLVESDPRNPPGWPVLLFVWGRIVGWSEVAIRSLSLFAGLLTLAWVYRTGRDMFSPGAGLVAALLLGTSVFSLPTWRTHVPTHWWPSLPRPACGITGASPCTRGRPAGADRRAYC